MRIPSERNLVNSRQHSRKDAFNSTRWTLLSQFIYVAIDRHDTGLNAGLIQGFVETRRGPRGTAVSVGPRQMKYFHECT